MANFEIANPENWTNLHRNYERVQKYTLQAQDQAAIARLCERNLHDSTEDVELWMIVRRACRARDQAAKAEWKAARLVSQMSATNPDPGSDANGLVRKARPLVRAALGAAQEAQESAEHVWNLYMAMP